MTQVGQSVAPVINGDFEEAEEGGLVTHGRPAR